MTRPLYNNSMIKIAIIGAASLTFSHKLLMDLLTMKLNDHCRIILMGPRAKPLKMYQSHIQKVISDNAIDFSVYSTTNMREAVDGADYVLTLFAIGGLPCTEQDYKIPLSYGVDQCIGDSMGPGGIFRSQRVLPVFCELVKLMQAHCPDAFLMNYVNPMAITTMAADRLGFKRYIGLCGGVEATKNYMAHVLNEQTKNLDFAFAGINHMCFALSVKKDGVDLYPEFKSRMHDPGYLVWEKVRFDVMQHFGYFATESSGHLSDFLPWYRSNPTRRERYGSNDGFHGASGAYFKFSRFIAKNLGEDNYLQFSDTSLQPRSNDYGVNIIEALHNKTDYSFYGNVCNTGGYIDNLPASAAVEIPVRIEKGAVLPQHCGSLPPALRAMIQTNLNVHDLCMEAFFSGDSSLLVAALAFDPLTSSVLSPHSCTLLAREMLEKQKRFFPQFEEKPLMPTQHIKANYAKKPYPVPEEFDLSALVNYRRSLRKLGKKDG